LEFIFTRGVRRLLKERELYNEVYNKVDIAIARIKTMYPVALKMFGQYTVMVSGGKDSSTITDLAIRSGVNCRFVVAHTGIEHPETVYFLRREKQRLEKLGYNFNFDIPRYKDGSQKTMWKLIEKKGLPTRQRRFCCEHLKEFAGYNSYNILGIRWEESARRKNTRFIHETQGYAVMTNNDNEANRRMTEACVKKNKYILNPIIEWTTADVWDYIHKNNLPYNPLYNMGFSRVGCIGCPMKNNRKELLDHPRFYNLYKKAAQRYLDNPERDRSRYKANLETYLDWWFSHYGSQVPTGTSELFEDEGEL
jgi:phosphoadenosine phosphosulfate reductase